MVWGHMPVLADKLKKLRHDFLRMCRNDVPGILASRTYAQNVRKVLQDAMKDLDAPKKRWALMAVGGFGRGELSFLSDLDLLFLYARKLPKGLESVVRELVYGLWDADFEVGHVTASISHVKQLMREDFSVETTYLEAQFIAGDQKLFDKWRKSIEEGYGVQMCRRFLKKLIHYREERLAQYGESSYLLEPHVKEGIGGLRDIHMLHWAAKVFLKTGKLEALRTQQWITREEQHWVEQAHDFLWRVRLQLHQLNNRRQDQLLLSDQKKVAKNLGFTDGKEGSAVEAFMRYYYRRTARVRRVSSFLLERLVENEFVSKRKFRMQRRILPGPLLLDGPHIQFLEPELIPQNPGILMRFFWQVAQSGAHFHHQVGHIIRRNLVHFTDQWRDNSEVVQQFFDILLNSEHAFRVLKTMMETGFLEQFLPEFAAIRYRVQYDLYHLYTVDEHLLRTVNEIHRMARGDGEESMNHELKQAFSRVENQRVLLLAALIHDVGKGLGKNHSARGAAMAKIIGRRLRLQPDEIDLLEYLVAHHLLLAETALKRDLSDEKPIIECALKIKDQEHLRMLYLLTVADSRATGPGAWNTWRSSLLGELYHKLDHILSGGAWRAADIEARTTKTRLAVLELLKDREDPETLEKWMDGLSFRYLMSQEPEAIAKHYFLEQELKTESLALATRPTEGEMWEITLAARDRPGLFACVCGILWVHGLNILAADIYTRRSGVALDVLVVERLPDELHQQELWVKMRSDLSRSIRDQDYLKRLIDRVHRSSWLVARRMPVRPDRVVIDENASDFYTVIEVYTWDRPGVLYAIANCLFELGISIQLAKISTPGAQVVDVFYVTDTDGNKLLDDIVHERIEERLLACLQAC